MPRVYNSRIEVRALRWVADRLKMDHYTRVTQAVSQGREPGKRLAQLCKQVERGAGNAFKRKFPVRFCEPGRFKYMNVCEQPGVFVK